MMASLLLKAGRNPQELTRVAAYPGPNGSTRTRTVIDLSLPERESVIGRFTPKDKAAGNIFAK